MSDNRSRLLYKNAGGVSTLIEILNKHGQHDWILAMLVCQTIWNYCIDTANLYEIISDAEIQELLKLLADYLGKQLLRFG